MTILLIVMILLFIALIGVSIFLVRQTRKEKNEKTLQTIKALLDKNEFVAKGIFTVSKELAIAFNKKGNMIAVAEISKELRIYFINSRNIINITKTPLTINIDYINRGNKLTLSIPVKNKNLESLVHELYKNALVKRLQEKYSINTFQYSSASDWECSYVWAFRPLRTIFAYCKTTDHRELYKLNLLREFFTINVKLDYFEAPVMGIAQQLNIYEKGFLSDIFQSLLNVIKQKYTCIVENRIYYNVDNDIVYLTNNVTSLQSIIIKETEEVTYKDDRLTFTLKDAEKTINFPADKEMLEEFENFVTSYNLRKIATSFDYEVDKLINTTEGTKFIVNGSRDRIVYCAGLGSLSKFSYLTIMFSNLESATYEKSKDTYFVRIHTKDNQTIDVTCLKPTVAQYIMAQITTIINS